MKRIKALLLITLGLFYFSGIAYARCQIQYNAEADRVLHLGGDTLRGNFATADECWAYWGSRPAFEQNHSKCVGCNEQNSSRTQQGSQPGVKYLGKDSQGRPHWSISGPTNHTPEEEEMIRRARRTKNPFAALEAMKKERQQKQLEEARKGQQSRAEFEQGKKEMLTQLKGGSGGGGLILKGGGRTLALKPGNVAAANHGDEIKDLRNSVYWALKAASAVSNGNNENYETARQHSEYSAQAYAGSDIELPSVPDVPAPVHAHPQIRLYKYLIKNTNRAASELKLINTNLKQVEEEKRKSEGKIDQQKAKIKELKQKKSVRKKNDKQEDMDKLITAAKAELDAAKKQDREASKNIISLNEQKKGQEENLSNLRQAFDMVNKHPEQAGKILKKFEGGKQ